MRIDAHDENHLADDPYVFPIHDKAVALAQGGIREKDHQCLHAAVHTMDCGLLHHRCAHKLARRRHQSQGRSEVHGAPTRDKAIQSPHARTARPQQGEFRGQRTRVIRIRQQICRALSPRVKVHGEAYYGNLGSLVQRC